MCGAFEQKDILVIALSILLAAAISQSLNTLSIYIDAQQPFLWLFLSLLFILGGVVVIFMVLEIEKSSIDAILSLKIALLSFFSLFVFGLSRYYYFLEKNPSTDKTIFITSFSLLFGCGIILITWYYKQDTQTRNTVLAIGGVLMLLVSVGFIIICLGI